MHSFALMHVSHGGMQDLQILSELSSHENKGHFSTHVFEFRKKGDSHLVQDEAESIQCLHGGLQNLHVRSSLSPKKHYKIYYF